jgi:hypothetical protein
MILTQPLVPTVRDASLPVLLVALLVVYLTPSVVAFTISRERSRAVLAINLFLGWSLVGWAVSLAMALERLRSAGVPPHANLHEPGARLPTAVTRRSRVGGPQRRP